MFNEIISELEAFPAKFRTADKLCKPLMTVDRWGEYEHEDGHELSGALRVAEHNFRDARKSYKNGDYASCKRHLEAGSSRLGKAEDTAHRLIAKAQLLAAQAPLRAVEEAYDEESRKLLHGS